ncbi:MAG TPA: beta-ketoacyl synthase N-terminal-like domain-containing protein [Polyangiaceae bacterium]|nr:beta-ketoacyl synthase N-terminal-like domain-containing protein [Polyangiaceae bacterium]
MTPRAVTGFGVASALGVGRAEFVAGLRAGTLPRTMGTDVQTFDASRYPQLREGARIAEVRGFDATRYLGDKGLRPLDRLTKLLIVSARLALEDAGLKAGGTWADATGRGDGARPWPERVGLVVSNAYGSLEAIHELHRVALLEDARYINPSRFPLTVSNSAAGYASIWEDLRAVNVTVSDGNCGALDAVACADVLLGGERAEALLVGGVEAMSEGLFVALDRLGATGASPAAEPRAGAVLGEGAALAVLETSAAAHARGAQVLAEVIGYGTSFAAPAREASLVHASPEALARAIEAALSDAGVAARDVDVVVSGASGLRAFDSAELGAIGRTLGDEACVVAPKRALGETLGAGGAMGMLSAIAYLRDEARSHVVRGTLRAKVRTALVTSLGYYGNASALVMRAA